MPLPIVGLHHVTAIASDPQRNLDFYTDVLGLRFVKRTVNFGDPGSYHFYFGDDRGSPGTLLTFFAWPHASRGHAGVGEVTRTSFSVPLTSIDFWEQRLLASKVRVERTGRRFEEDVLTFPDTDGMKIEIVGHVDAEPVDAPRYASVPPEHAIRGLFGVTLFESNIEPTAAILNLMGFWKSSEDGNRFRFAAEGKALGNHIDLLIDPNAQHGLSAAGSVHHIAFRTENDASQREWGKELLKLLEVTPVFDRSYFHSIYFREPGGVLFELATDPPGFLLDEPIECLGQELRLPAWLEPRRSLLEATLPKIELHKRMPSVELKLQREDLYDR